MNKERHEWSSVPGKQLCPLDQCTHKDTFRLTDFVITVQKTRNVKMQHGTFASFLLILYTSFSFTHILLIKEECQNIKERRKAYEEAAWSKYVKRRASTIHTHPFSGSNSHVVPHQVVQGGKGINAMVGTPWSDQRARMSVLLTVNANKQRPLQKEIFFLWVLFLKSYEVQHTDWVTER